MQENTSSDPLIAEWRQHGLHVVRELLGPDETGYLRSLDVASFPLREYNDRKQLWMIDPTVRRIAIGESLRNPLNTLFDGSGYYLWGAQVIDRQAREVHPWHSDLETCNVDDGFVSLWIPVSGVSPHSTLHVIDGSHRYGRPLQTHFAWDHPARLDPDAKSVLAWAIGNGRRAELRRVDCDDSDAVFFDGCLWHGTFNGSDQPRRSLLLQYGRQDAPVRWVKNRRVSPPELDENALPVVLPLSGAANPLLNHNIFQHGDDLAYPRASIARRPALDNEGRQAWMRFPYFKTKTDVSETLICHASELLPACMPHMPHSHHLEEVLIVLDGEATIFSHNPEAGVLQAVPASAGDFFYYPKGHPHTICNQSGGPIRYLMFRWKTHAPTDSKALWYHYRGADYSSAEERFSIDRPSSGLSHLHCHFTRLRSGEAFPTHIDRHDTAVVVLRGRLSMLDMELGPRGVFFARAGEVHNTRNESSELCEYMVFEFHARTEC